MQVEHYVRALGNDLHRALERLLSAACRLQHVVYAAVCSRFDTPRDSARICQRRALSVRHIIELDLTPPV